MNQIKLSAGTIEYADTGGDGPVLVLLHGLLMDATLWNGTVAQLAGDYRCVVPTLPLGAHQHPMAADADLSLPGQARLVAELLDRLDLTNVTLVGNDTGGAIAQLMIAQPAPRIGRLVLVSCDAFDNIPPGLTGRAIALLGHLPPGLFGLFMQQLRLRFVRRLPFAFGWLTKRGDAITVGWLRPILHRSDIRRDATRALRNVFADRQLLLRAAGTFDRFDRPALVVWASEDKVMPPEHGRRLAEQLAQGRLVEISDSATLVPLDQPVALAEAIRAFAKSTEDIG